MKRYLLFAALAALTRLPTFGLVPLGDESAHLLGSWQVLRGRELYRDFADNKPPLLYAAYALPQRTAARSMDVVRGFAVLVTLPLTALGLSAFFRHDRRGLWAGALYLLAGCCDVADNGLAVNAEPLMVLPATWALALVRDEDRAARPARAAAAGALLGAACLFKTTAAPWLLAAPVALLLGGATKAAAAGLAASSLGFFVPLLATYALFAARGRADELVYWNVTHNLQYAANLQSGAALAGRLLTKGGPWILGALPLLWGAWCGAGRLGSSYRLRLVALAFGLSLPGVLVGGRFYGHYFVQLLPALALAAAPWAEELWGRWPLAAHARRWAFAALVPVALFTAINLAVFRLWPGLTEETLPVYAETSRVLDAQRCSRKDSLFVWGFAPLFYTETRRLPASRFVLPQASLTGFVPGNPSSLDPDSPTTALIDERHWDLLLDDLRRNRATFILDTAPSGLHRWDRYPLARFPRLRALVETDYEQVAVVDGVVVYRRRDCP